MVDAEAIQQIRDSYLCTLVAPMDGMWESAVIARATFWEIEEQGQRAGYFCVDAENYLLRFHVLGEYQARAQEIFRWVISSRGIQCAMASTIEPLYFSLCLDVQSSMAIQSYLFRDHRRVALPADCSGGTFRKAEESELDDMVRFYRANTEGPGEWIEAFLQRRLGRGELFVLHDGQTVVATGECIASEKQVPYADLGMVVAQSYRGRGVGSAMLVRLKAYCYEMGWKPICSCAADNGASKRAIEKAGFVSEQRMVKVQLL
jgi:GNAT superfamily N-acetyltransferase